VCFIKRVAYIHIPENNSLLKIVLVPTKTRNPLTKTDELTTTNEQKTQFNNTLSQLLCNPIVSLAHTSRALTQLAESEDARRRDFECAKMSY
jgi:hypothetical protein